MPVYWFWGEDDFSMEQAIERLQREVLDPAWRAFNYEKLGGDRDTALIDALNQALTPPFGSGGRLVWLNEPALSSSPELVKELERTLPVVPASSTLLLTSRKKPDGRSKVVKLLQHHSRSREFALIPPWREEELFQRVQDAARDLGVSLTAPAAQVLATAVGNDTRQLWNELAKLRVFALNRTQPLEVEEVADLVAAHNQNSLQLAAAIRDGKTSDALQLATELLQRNEPALRIAATLTNQFRTWLLLKLAVESGEKNEPAIAARAELGNPKRVYFLRRELRALSGQQLLAVLPLLLDLEDNLKRGAEPCAALQTSIIQLCTACQERPRSP